MVSFSKKHGLPHLYEFTLGLKSWQNELCLKKKKSQHFFHCWSLGFSHWLMANGYTPSDTNHQNISKLFWINHSTSPTWIKASHLPKIFGFGDDFNDFPYESWFPGSQGSGEQWSPLEGSHSELENCHRNDVDFPSKDGDFPVRYVNNYQRVIIIRQLFWR